MRSAYINRNMKIVIFDVDGTLVNGNCTYIFMRYLFENKIIEPEHFSAFNSKFNKYCSSGTLYSEIISESIQAMSVLGITQFRIHWKKCFDERVRMKFNKDVLIQLKEFQLDNTEIALASGSHQEIISLVGEEFNVKSENIIATRSDRLYQIKSSFPSESICYGEEKMRRVIDFLNFKNIELSQVIFFTDNVSDLGILSVVGKGMWVGSNDAYYEYSLVEKGIENFNSDYRFSDLYSTQEVTLNTPLQDYYNKFSAIIEQSISEILPEECTVESMNNLVGTIELAWDMKTLQHSFFEPAYKYIRKKKQKVIGLGSCIFIEAAGTDTLKFIPLIGIGDLLEMSAEMFLDIKEWTSEENIQFWNKSRLDNAIIGNVSIAMMSMVTNNVIFNRLPIDDERKSAIYEGLTSVIFHALFGNGLKLFLEQQNEILTSEEEYFKIALFTNMASLQLPCDFWRILRAERLSEKEVGDLNSFIENLSIATQLTKDLISFNLWRSNLPPSRTNKFNLFTNFLIIHGKNCLNNPFVITKDTPKESVCELITRTGSELYTLEKSDEFKNRAFASLDELPIGSRYNDLIRQYSICLMNRK